MEEEKNEIKRQIIFNGKDFNNWKFRMEVQLREHDVEKFIETSLEEFEEIVITHLDDAASRARKEKLKEDFRKKERKCYSLIVQRIGNDYLEYVKDKPTPKEAWASMCGNFERKGVLNRMFLRRKLLLLKLKENGNLVSHIHEFEKILRELKSAGGKMEKEEEICQLLVSLPESFESVTAALENLQPEELTMELVKGRLLDHDIKKNSMNIEHRSEIKKAQNVFENQPSAMTGCSKKEIVCFTCGKKGHYKNNCPENAVQNCNCKVNRNYRANYAEDDDNGSDSSF